MRDLLPYDVQSAYVSIVWLYLFVSTAISMAAVLFGAGFFIISMIAMDIIGVLAASVILSTNALLFLIRYDELT